MEQTGKHWLCFVTLCLCVSVLVWCGLVCVYFPLWLSRNVCSKTSPQEKMWVKYCLLQKWHELLRTDKDTVSLLRWTVKMTQ